ncbi:hypothetical protein A2U01_0028059, partial [Trifolium medium]|nr:hypothetical protein [Trifolium medium]
EGKNSEAKQVSNIQEDDNFKDPPGRQAQTTRLESLVKNLGDQLKESKEKLAAQLEALNAQIQQLTIQVPDLTVEKCKVIELRNKVVEIVEKPKRSGKPKDKSTTNKMGEKNEEEPVEKEKGD